MGIDVCANVDGELDVSNVSFGFSIQVSMDDFNELIHEHWGCEVEEDEMDGVLDQILSDNPFLLSDFMNVGEFLSDSMSLSPSVTLTDGLFTVVGDMTYNETIPFSIEDWDTRLRTWQDDLLSEIRGSDYSDFDYGDFQYSQRDFKIDSANIEGETDMGDDFEETY